jgi:beta-glucosidase
VTSSSLKETAVSPLTFPPGFWWGAATAAYQIEGASKLDGRTPSIWDTFAATPGKVVDGHTGEEATDHYHRFAQDIELMRRLGLTTYRFSVAWPRIQPGGRGPANPEGVGFYDRLVDALLLAGIKPAVTLYHWDLPQELEDAGGWTVRDTALRFADYARIVGERLGDRVALWSTLNEPWCSAFLGYSFGVHAPGRTEPGDGLRAAHHLLLAHGLGTGVLRETAPGTPVSLVLNLGAVRAASDSAADRAAARKVDGLINRIWLDPVLRGHYPADVMDNTAALVDWSMVHDGDLAAIGAPIDLLGVNYYQPSVVAHGDVPLAAPNPWPGCDDVAFPPIPGPVTGMDWPVDATGLREVLVRLHTEYPGVPIMVTENGAAYADEVVDGAVHDADRIAYLREHLIAAHEALAAGVDLRGYYAWSLLDNFEWAYGYSQRFGLIHVDYATQARTLKDSAYWYRDVIARNGLA